MNKTRNRTDISIAILNFIGNKGNIFTGVKLKKLVFLNLLILIVIFGSACADRRGYVAINGPYVMDPDKTKISLEAQKNNILKKAGELKVSEINVRSRIQESRSREYRAGVEDIANSLNENGEEQRDTTAPDLPASAADKATLPDYAAFTEPTTALFSEKLNDIAMKESHMEGIKLKYGGDIFLQGYKAKIYMVEFDLWAETERQHYFSYLYRWLDFNNGFRNYTKDYHAEVHFVLPSSKLEQNGDQQIIVHAVQPINESVTAEEDWMSKDRSSLGLAYRQANAAAQTEFAEQLRLQMIEQRKHPLVRGVIDSQREFHFVLSPRQHVERRKARIPYFMSRYKLARRLEQESRKVYAYILIKEIEEDKIEEYCKNINKQKKALETKVNNKKKLTIEDETLAWHFIKKTNYETDENKLSAEMNMQVSCNEKTQTLNVPLLVYANYKKFGSPMRTGQMLPIRGGSLESALGDDPDGDDDLDARIINVKLPLKRFKSVKEINVDFPVVDNKYKPDYVGLVWGSMNLNTAPCSPACNHVNLQVKVGNDFKDVQPIQASITKKATTTKINTKIDSDLTTNMGGKTEIDSESTISTTTKSNPPVTPSTKTETVKVTETIIGTNATQTKVTTTKTDTTVKSDTTPKSGSTVYFELEKYGFIKKKSKNLFRIVGPTKGRKF